MLQSRLTRSSRVPSNASLKNMQPACSKRAQLAAAIILLGLASPVWAQDAFPVSGEEESTGLAGTLGLQTSLRAAVWTHDRDFNGRSLTPNATLRARIAPHSGSLDGFAEGYVETHGRGDADLVEGWMRYTNGNLELKAGRQIVVWGRADRLNPTDNISSTDYTMLVADDDEQRRGNFMVQSRIGLGLFTLDGYWLPEFRSNIFPFDTRRPGIAFLPDQEISDNRQFAMKLDRSGGSVDWSLSWFHGTDRNRDIVFIPFTPPGPFVAVQQRFPKLDVLGADLAGTVGQIGYRAEIAYTDVRGQDDLYHKNSNIWAVAGIDTPVLDVWNLNLQYSRRHILDYSDPWAITNPAARAVTLQSAAVNNQLDRNQNGVTLRVARKWLQDTLDFELSSVVWMETGDATVRPKLSYAVNDQLRITAGADIFIGPALSYFGRARNLSGGFVQVNSGF